MLTPNNKDPHNQLALQLYGEVTPENRHKAKSLNFFYLYGAKPDELKAYFERFENENYTSKS